MSKWYEEAVFYHMYPIGMTGAPRQNTQEEVTHRFQELMEVASVCSVIRLHCDLYRTII